MALITVAVVLISFVLICFSYYRVITFQAWLLLINYFFLTVMHLCFFLTVVWDTSVER